MKKVIKIMAIILAVGVLALTVGFIIKWSNPTAYADLFEKQYVEKIITEDEIVTSFSLIYTSGSVRFEPSTDDKLSIKYYETDSMQYAYSFSDGKAVFSSKSIFSLKDLFRFGKNSYATVIYLPTTVAGKLDVSVSSGQLTLSGLTNTLQALNVVVGSGQTSLSNITCQTLNITVNSGKLYLSGVQAVNSNLTLASGDINLANCSLGNLVLDVNSGEIEAQNLTIQSISGEIDSGDTEINLAGTVEDYAFNCKANSGEIELYNNGARVTETAHLFYGNGVKTVNITLKSGDLDISVGSARFDD